jgi:hypothetical protein
MAEGKGGLLVVSGIWKGGDQWWVRLSVLDAEGAEAHFDCMAVDARQAAGFRQLLEAVGTARKPG